jgi:hypothetical protein
MKKLFLKKNQKNFFGCFLVFLQQVSINTNLRVDRSKKGQKAKKWPKNTQKFFFFSIFPRKQYFLLFRTFFTFKKNFCDNSPQSAFPL